VASSAFAAFHHPLADDPFDGGLGEGTGDDLASPVTLAVVGDAGGVGPQVAGEPANWGQDSRVGGEVPVHRRFTDADGGLPELASSPVPSVHQLRVVLRGVSPLIWRRLRRENGVRPAGQPYPDATPSLRAARGTYPTDPEVASTADPGTSESRGQGGIRLLKIT
jgi:hypothetical protein